MEEYEVLFSENNKESVKQFGEFRDSEEKGPETTGALHPIKTTDCLVPPIPGGYAGVILDWVCLMY